MERVHAKKKTIKRLTINQWWGTPDGRSRPHKSKQDDDDALLGKLSLSKKCTDAASLLPRFENDPWIVMYQKNYSLPEISLDKAIGKESKSPIVNQSMTFRESEGWTTQDEGRK